MKFRTLLLPVLLLLSLPLAAQKHRAVRTTGNTLTIGGLFSLTGDGSTLGIASKAALELAARDINAEFTTLGLPWRVTTDVEDTKLTSSLAADKIRVLDAAGASVVIGPQSSAEAGAILDYVNANDIILISQGSTASTLAIANDNLFRLAPNDRLEGAAMAALLRADGIDTILPIWRDDAGNGGLRNGVVNAFLALGGSAATGVSYAPTTTDFTATVNILGAQLRTLKAQKPNAKIAVLAATFEEAAAIFALARFDADLGAVRWYGTDGAVQSQALIAPASVGRFAAATQFTAPNVGLSDATKDRWKPISDEIQTRIGFTPDAYSLSVYDAAWVAALSAAEVQMNGAKLREAFVRNVQRYWGLTGPTSLDAAGDRRIATFDFWTVRDNGIAIEWVRTGHS
jgi:branched-chain amino acid transport system substrate-binding protein